MVQVDTVYKGPVEVGRVFGYLGFAERINRSVGNANSVIPVHLTITGS